MMILQPVGCSHEISGLDINFLEKELGKPVALVIVPYDHRKEEFDNLDNKIKKLRGNGKNVFWMPKVSGANKQDITDGQNIVNIPNLYQAADFILCTSKRGGLGHALINAIYYKKIFLLSNDSPFKDDYLCKGIKFFEIDDEFNIYKIFNKDRALESTFEEFGECLTNPSLLSEVIEDNFTVGKRYFSHRFLIKKLNCLLTDFFGV